MENTENTTETPSTDAPPPEAPEPTTAEAEQPAEDPNALGKLSPEEQTALMMIRQQSQQLLAKVGEHEVLKQRLLARLDELDKQGQDHINGVSKRLGIEDGQQWVALQDGTIRLVNNNGESAPG